MAIISRKYKLLYIMFGGTGCTSLGEVLIEKFGGEKLPPYPIRGIQQKHNTIQQLIRFGLIKRHELAGVLKFSTRRNPFDRVVTTFMRISGSWYEEQLQNKNSWVYRDPNFRHIIRKEMELARRLGFEKWVALKYGFIERTKRWVKYILPWKSGFPLGREFLYFTSGVDYYLTYENLQEDFKNLLKSRGIEWNSMIPNINPTPLKQAYRSYYTGDSKKL